MNTSPNNDSPNLRAYCKSHSLPSLLDDSIDAENKTNLPHSPSPFHHCTSSKPADFHLNVENLNKAIHAIDLKKQRYPTPNPKHNNLDTKSDLSSYVVYTARDITHASENN
jgi:hypothetical protein